MGPPNLAAEPHAATEAPPSLLHYFFGALLAQWRDLQLPQLAASQCGRSDRRTAGGYLAIA